MNNYYNSRDSVNPALPTNEILSFTGFSQTKKLTTSLLQKHCRQVFLVVTFLLMASGSKALAQANLYSYSSTTGNALETFTSSTVVTTTVGGTFDDDYNIVAPSGFTFKFNGTDYTQFGLSTNGWLQLGNAAVSGSRPTAINGFGVNAIAVFERDSNMNLANGGNLTHGPAAGGKYVFQFTKFSGGGFGGESGTSYATIQIVLWGSTSATPGKIDIIYGTSAGSPASNGVIGITDAANTYVNGVNGLTNSTATASAWPASGTKYSFTPPPPCVVPTSLAATASATGQTQGSISASFTAATTAPTGYLVVRTTTNVQPTPVAATTYTVGSNAIGYIEYINTAAGSWTSAGLTGGTTYYYWVFSYNNTVCSGGPLYSASATSFNHTTEDRKSVV